MSKRVLKTKLCDMLGIDYPILSAGIVQCPTGAFSVIQNNGEKKKSANQFRAKSGAN